MVGVSGMDMLGGLRPEPVRRTRTRAGLVRDGGRGSPPGRLSLRVNMSKGQFGPEERRPHVSHLRRPKCPSGRPGSPTSDFPARTTTPATWSSGHKLEARPPPGLCSLQLPGPRGGPHAALTGVLSSSVAQPLLGALHPQASRQGPRLGLGGGSTWRSWGPREREPVRAPHAVPGPSQRGESPAGGPGWSHAPRISGRHPAGRGPGPAGAPSTTVCPAVRPPPRLQVQLLMPRDLLFVRATRGGDLQVPQAPVHPQPCRPPRTLPPPRSTLGCPGAACPPQQEAGSARTHRADTRAPTRYTLTRTRHSLLRPPLRPGPMYPRRGHSDPTPSPPGLPAVLRTTPRGLRGPHDPSQTPSTAMRIPAPGPCSLPAPPGPHRALLCRESSFSAPGRPLQTPPHRRPPGLLPAMTRSRVRVRFPRSEEQSLSSAFSEGDWRLAPGGVPIPSQVLGKYLWDGRAECLPSARQRYPC